jgi:hypothetical protein
MNHEATKARNEGGKEGIHRRDAEDAEEVVLILILFSWSPSLKVEVRSEGRQLASLFSVPSASLR